MYEVRTAENLWEALLLTGDFSPERWGKAIFAYRKTSWYRRRINQEFGEVFRVVIPAFEFKRFRETDFAKSLSYVEEQGEK